MKAATNSKTLLQLAADLNEQGRVEALRVYRAVLRSQKPTAGDADKLHWAKEALGKSAAAVAHDATVLERAAELEHSYVGEEAVAKLEKEHAQARARVGQQIAAERESVDTGRRLRRELGAALAAVTSARQPVQTLQILRGQHPELLDPDYAAPKPPPQVEPMARAGTTWDQLVTWAVQVAVGRDSVAAAQAALGEGVGPERAMRMVAQNASQEAVAKLRAMTPKLRKQVEKVVGTAWDSYTIQDEAREPGR